MKKRQIVALGSVPLGATFIFRQVEILGFGRANRPKPRYEGQVLTVVGFEPHYVNKVVVRQANGAESLMPLDMVEKALSLESRQVSRDLAG